MPHRSQEQDLVRNLARLILPIGGIVILFLFIMRVDLGTLMIVGGIFLFPVGLVVMADDRKVSKRDTDIAPFLRSLGGLMQAIGATAAEAMGRLDFRSLGVLKEDVSLLHTRLLAGITPNLCWNRFVCETGSELVNRSVRNFFDGVTLGGEPQKVGNEASAFAMKISLLRAQRSQIDSGFTWLTIAMHIVLTALSVFVYSVFVTFSQLVKTLMPEGVAAFPNMPTLGLFAQNSMQLNLLHFVVILIIIILTLADTFAIYSVGGGHISKLLFYLAITAAISGGVLVLVPPVVNMMFGIVG
jgi:flagellar protein FlaJ